ncbi:MAG: FAD-dependent oxidoreductase [Armatimonadetes bacterium]|nr:FAD-dependent oxidoreductase [Armatimonadota bacterium]
MADYKYLIIGGGMSAAAAARGIRQIDADGSIGLIGNDINPPYKRPLLTKGLWTGKPEDSIWLKIEEANVDAHYGRTAVLLNADAHSVIDDKAAQHTFEKLLLATGGSPRRFPFDAGDDVIYFRTYADYKKLRALADTGESFIVIGGGFIGSEIAAALAMNDKKVTLVFPEAYIGANIYPPDLGAFLNGYYRERGVDVITEATVASVGTSNGKKTAILSTGQELIADGIIAGLGITPNLALAQAAGLKVTNGIHVNDLCQTSHPDIFACGDVADFYNFSLSTHMRVEHEDNALTMGNYAGMAMAGAGQPYHHLPYFYSDLFDLGYEAVGQVSSKLEAIEDWKEPFKEGVVYYMQDGKVRGVLLWNVWDKVPAARELIAENGQALGLRF